MRSSQRLSLADQLGAAFRMDVPNDISRLSLQGAHKRFAEAMSIRDFDEAEKLLLHAYELSPCHLQAVKIAKFYVLNRRDPLAAETWFQKAYAFTHDSRLAKDIARFLENHSTDKVGAAAWFGMSRRARNTEQFMMMSLAESQSAKPEPTPCEKIEAGWKHIIAHLNPAA
ncbi:MAG: hypothetical protein AB7E85_02745 [Pseudobdellovibrionaceae bacterium]